MTRSWLMVTALLLAAPAHAQVDEDVEAGGGDASEEEASAEAASEPLPARDPGQPAEPEPVHFVLENGLSVWLQPVPGRRFSAVAVTYRVGSGDVPVGWTGLAHLTEHLMFSGTDELGEVETYLRLEAAGAVDRNAETGPDRTLYHEVLPTSQLGEALFLESHRMARLLAGLTEARVARQQEVVLHEGWERGTYGWRGLLAGSLYRGTFPETHPYARAIVERPDDVAAIRLPHVQWFFQQHYAPDNAVLSVVGGFDPEVLRSEIEARFGPIRRSAPRPARPDPPAVAPLDHERRITIAVQDDRDQLIVAWPTPALYAPGDAELDVLSTLLSQHRDAPVRRALVESGLALEAYVAQRSHRLGSIFTVHAIPAPGHDTGELLTVLDRVLRELPAFDDAAVARARGRWVRQERLRIEDLGTRALRLGLATDRFVPTPGNERARYAAVQAGDVAAVRDRWLPLDRRLVLTVRARPDGPSRGNTLQDEHRGTR
ncbi:MAG: M16 family metallopeptidase [Sandaracinaceae bacterium]